MKNLTEIVKQYKQVPTKELSEIIFEELKSIIKQKTKYIFFKKWYPYSLYHKCKECRICEETDKIICKNCDNCTCEKGVFNLNKSKLCEYDDVKNDLILEILRIIKNYNPEKDFNTYLIACLWEWRPSFINKNFIKSLQNKSLTQTDEEEQEKEMDISCETFEEPKISLEQIYSVCKNETEKKIFELLEGGLKQREIAIKLEVSEQYISKVIIKLRKKLIKLVNKNENQNL